MSGAEMQSLRIVAFLEGDVWMAQCVEYDLCVQGDSLAQVQRRMSALVRAEATYTTDKHGKAFEGLDPAPDYFEAMFQSAADASLQSEMDFRIAA